MIAKIKSSAKASLICSAAFVSLLLSSCTFQPLYNSPDGAVGTSNVSLASFSVAEVKDRPAQQVRNHLIFLLSGGITPLNPQKEVRLRVNAIEKVIAVGIGNDKIGVDRSIGNTASSVEITVSYDVYDFASKTIIARGTRVASAGFDKTSQSFANIRAQRDAENRAAKAAAEQVRLAIASQMSNN